MEIKILENKTEVAKSFSAYFAELVQSQEQLFVALSGGSTPKTVFDYLASEYRNKIDFNLEVILRSDVSTFHKHLYHSTVCTCTDSTCNN